MLQQAELEGRKAIYQLHPEGLEAAAAEEKAEMAAMQPQMELLVRPPTAGDVGGPYPSKGMKAPRKAPLALDLQHKVSGALVDRMACRGEMIFCLLIGWFPCSLGRSHLVESSAGRGTT